MLIGPHSDIHIRMYVYSYNAHLACSVVRGWLALWAKDVEARGKKAHPSCSAFMACGDLDGVGRRFSGAFFALLALLRLRFHQPALGRRVCVELIQNVDAQAIAPKF